jgi:hypothetical protein
MTYRGRVKNGLIELDPGTSLPEGAIVSVQPVEASPPFRDKREDDPIWKLGTTPVTVGVCDGSERHDDYVLDDLP